MQPTADDQPFRHYTARHRAVAWVSQRVFDNFTYTVRHGLLEGMKRKGGLGWLPRSLSGAAGSPEQAFLSKRNFANLVVYDIGAFQGLMTLFFSRSARLVVAYEPNSRNHARLMENLRLNRVENAIVRKVGVGSRSDTATMVSDPLFPGGSSVDGNMVAGIRRAGPAPASESISIVRLDDDIPASSLPAPDFIKIDIEGGELPALEGARNTLRLHAPQLLIEMHGETMNLKRKNARDVVSCLRDLGYTGIMHVESGSVIGAYNSEIAAEGHLYCMSRAETNPPVAPAILSPVI